MTQQATSKVEELATQKQALSGHQLALIGLFGAGDDLQALVRMKSGRIKHIEIGTRLPIGRVVAIDADGLVVERGGTTNRLSMLAQE